MLEERDKARIGAVGYGERVTSLGYAGIEREGEGIDRAVD